MKKWLSYALSLMLLFTMLPTAAAQAEGQGHGSGWGDHWMGGKGKPDKGKPQRGKEKKVKASGVVSALDETAGTLTIEIKGSTIELLMDSNTKLQVTGWKRPSFSDIWVGDKANVEYIVQETKNIAKSIKVSKQKGSASGTLEAVNAENKTATVAGKTIQFTETTDIRWGKQKLQLTDLVAGDQISASGYLQEDVLKAVSVKVKRSVAVVKGAITSVDVEKNQLVVGSTTITLTEKTKISLNGAQAELSELQAGDKLVVIGVKQNDLFTASLITAQRQTVELKGTIESIDVTANTVTVAGKTLSVTEQTKIESDEKAITIADLQTGDAIKAQAIKKGDEWVALKIEVKNEEEDNDDHEGDDHGQKGEVEGKVEAVDASLQTLSVRGNTIQLNESTIIEGDHDQKLTFADLAVGVKIEAKGIWQDHVLIAQKIEVDNEKDDEEDED